MMQGFLGSKGLFRVFWTDYVEKWNKVSNKMGLSTEAQNWKGRRTQKTKKYGCKNKNQIFILNSELKRPNCSKSRLIICLYKKSNSTFSRTQMTQLLSKWENMAQKQVRLNLSECGTSEGSPAPLFWPNEMSFRLYEIFGQ